MPYEKPSFLTRLFVIASILPFFAACGDDSTGPSTSDLSQTQAEISQAFNRFIAENEGLMSFGEFSPAMGNALPAANIVNWSVVRDVSSPGNLTDIIRGGVATLRAPRSPSTASLGEAYAIPVAVLGTTFTYDPSSGGYQPDPSREGAPENGVRFILYDGVATLNEIGWVDIIDLSDFSVAPPTVDVSLAVVISEETLVSYRITGTGTDTSADLLATGFLSDGLDQLDFSLGLVASDATGADVDLTLTFADATINLLLSEATSGAEQFTATIDDGDNVVVMTMATDETGAVLDGSGVELDDIPVAVFSGNVNADVEITDPDGDPLSSQEQSAIIQLFGVVLQSALFMAELMVIGVGLIGLAFI